MRVEMGSQCSNPANRRVRRGDTDLWPLCRVSPFNNQWSLRANFPFSLSLSHCSRCAHFTSSFPNRLHHKNVLFTTFFLFLSPPTVLFLNCIQFSNLNRMCEWSGLWQKRKTEVDWLECWGWTNDEGRIQGYKKGDMNFWNLKTARRQTVLNVWRGQKGRKMKKEIL